MPSGSVTPAGGAAFNGGTITQELVVDTGAGTGQALELQGSRTTENDVFRIDYPHAAVLFDSDGAYKFQGDDGVAVQVQGTSGATASLQVSSSGQPSYELDLFSYGPFTVSYNNVQLFSVGQEAGLLALATSPPAPTTTTFSTGTGKQVSTARDARTFTSVTFNPTAGAAATCAVAISPDNVTYTALWTETEPAGVALDGTIHGIQAYVPAGWYLKLTVTNAVLGTTTYY